MFFARKYLVEKYTYQKKMKRIIYQKTQEKKRNYLKKTR